jgi:hypothetical protein
MSKRCPFAASQVDEILKKLLPKGECRTTNEALVGLLDCVLAWGTPMPHYHDNQAYESIFPWDRRYVDNISFH